MLGYADQSLRAVEEMIQLSEELAHPLTMAYALCFAALMRNHRGDHREAQELAEEALVITVENRFALWTAWAKMQQGWALASLGDFERGIPLMREGLLGWKNTGARVGFTFFPVTLAEMCLNSGRLDECATLLADALPMVQNNDEHFYEAELWRLTGECLSRREGAAAGDPVPSAAVTTSAVATESDADAHFTRAIAIAREQQAKAWELRSAMSRSRWLAARGRAAEALVQLGEIYARFTEGFATADLVAAGAELKRLEGLAPAAPPR
jgi:predicted ATPase